MWPYWLMFLLPALAALFTRRRRVHASSGMRSVRLDAVWVAAAIALSILIGLRLEVGDIVKTNYGTGPYRILKICRGCTCPSPADELNMINPPGSAPHMHLVCARLGDDPHSPKFYLNGFDEKTLKSVWSSDYLQIVKNNRLVQMTLL